MTKPKRKRPGPAAGKGVSAGPPKSAARAAPRRKTGTAAAPVDRPPPDPATEYPAATPTAPPPISTASADRWALPQDLAHDDAAAAWWLPVVTELRDRGRLHLLVPFQVAQFCQLLSQWWRATESLRRAGGQVLEIRDDKGQLKRQEIAPEVRLQLQLLGQLRALAKDFGLNEPPLDLKPTTAPNAGRNRIRAILEGAFGGGDAGRN